MSDSINVDGETEITKEATSEDIIDEGGAPVSRGDEGILEGVSIGESFEEGNSSGSDEEEEGIVIHAGRATSRRPIYKSFALKSQRNQLSALKDVASVTKKSGEDDELKKLRFVRHVTAFDVDINSLDEHPWRNKNVDLLDYFNYGFGENTWMEYCERQLRIRAGKGLGPHQPIKPVVHASAVQPSAQSSLTNSAVKSANILAPTVSEGLTLSTSAQLHEMQSATQLKSPVAFGSAQGELHNVPGSLPVFQHLMPPNAHMHSGGFPPHADPGWTQSGGMLPPRMQQQPYMGSGGGHQEMWGCDFQQQGIDTHTNQQKFPQHFQQHQQPPPVHHVAKESSSTYYESSRSERTTAPKSSSKRDPSPQQSRGRRADSRDRDKDDSTRSTGDRGRGRDDKGTDSSNKPKVSKDSSSSSRREISSSDYHRSGDRDRKDSERGSVRGERPSSKKDESRDSGGRRESKESSSASSSKRRHTESRSRSRDRKRVDRDPADERRRK